MPMITAAAKTLKIMLRLHRLMNFVLTVSLQMKAEVLILKNALALAIISPGTSLKIGFTHDL
jgi:hypothetical protein